MNLNPGEVWLADLGMAAKTRPVVIVSRHDLDPPRALAIYVPLTTQYRDSSYEVVLPRLRFLDRDSIANVQGIASIPTVRLERKLGKLPDEVMLKIKQALLFALDLEPDLAYKFTQIAWSRLLLDGIGVEFSSDYFCFNGAGNVIEQGVFVKQPFFVAAVKLAKNYSQSENFKMFAFMSADVSALNAALNQGSQPEDLVFSPACLFLEPTTSEGMEKAQKYISLKMSYKNSKKAAPASTPIQNKPWWKF